MYKQRGVALFQVLIITTILLLLATFISSKAKWQIESAKEIQDKQIAMLKANSALSIVKFNLITHSPDKLIDLKKWNFYGEEFDVEGVKVKIQDHNGLLALTKRVEKFKIDYLLRLARLYGYENNGVNSELVLNWIKNPDMIRIQNLEQLMHLGLSSETSSLIWSNLTVNPQSFINPINIPSELLAMYFSQEQASEIKRYRSELKFIEMKRSIQGIIEGNNINDFEYVIGPYFRVEIDSKVNQSSWKMQYELSIVKKHRGNSLVVLSQRPV